ncbi:hypothetical protein ACFWPK_03810 [Nocardia sp. NPDC058519]|uniref:hypothetical protein n=1 Tax=Nocardia sp. NPDC058519 TaxID=3346535 RepID=UPI0036625C7B
MIEGEPFAPGGGSYQGRPDDVKAITDRFAPAVTAAVRGGETCALTGLSARM